MLLLPQLKLAYSLSPVSKARKLFIKKYCAGRKFKVENLNLCKTVLASGMQLNPIPNVPDPYDLTILYIFFSIITILAITFIIGTILTRKYTSHKKLIGKIFVAMGTIELIPYILSVIHTILVNLPYLLYNYWMFLFILGCITLTGGAALLKKIKHHWTFFLIMAAIILIIWTFDAFFIYRY